jgi:hypothetical protein
MKGLSIATAVAGLLLQGLPAASASGEPRDRQLIAVPADDPVLNKANLDIIKRYIIANGARCTYSNMYNNNPCWALSEFSFYLNPDPGPDGHPQWNIDCDVTRGDFNTLVIKNKDDDYQSIQFRQEHAIVFQVWHETQHSDAAKSQSMIRAAVTASLAAIQNAPATPRPR